MTFTLKVLETLSEVHNKKTNWIEWLLYRNFNKYGSCVLYRYQIVQQLCRTSHHRYCSHLSFISTTSRREWRKLAPTHQSKTACWARASSGVDMCRMRCGCNWWDTDANRDRVHHSFRTGWRLSRKAGEVQGGEIGMWEQKGTLRKKRSLNEQGEIIKANWI